MRLQKLVLENWRSYKKFEHQFRPGITCIVGPNGSGKSSLLDAIQYSLVGSWGEYFKKQENINLTSEKAEALVTSVWSHNSGSRIEIRKRLPGGKAKLLIKADKQVKEFTYTADIDRQLEDLLGTPLDLVRQTVFVGQGQVDNFLHMPRSQWLNYFAQICGIDKVEKLWRALGDQAAADIQQQQQHLVLTVDPGDLAVDLRTAEKELEAVMEKLDAASQSFIPEEKRQYLKTLLAGFHQQSQVKAELAAAEQLQQQRDSKYTPVVQMLRQKLTQVTRACEKIKKQLANYEDQQDSRRKIVQDYESRKQLLSQTTLVEKTLLARRFEYKTAKEARQKAQAELDVTLENHNKIYSKLTAGRDQEQELTRKISLLKSGQCPTCGGKVSGSSVANYEQELAELTKTNTQLIDDLRVAARLKVKLQQTRDDASEKTSEAEAAVKLAEQQINEYRTKLEKIPVVEQAAFDEASAKLLNFRVLDAKRNKLESHWRKLNAKLTKVQNLLASSSKAVAILRRKNYRLLKLLCGRNAAEVERRLDAAISAEATVSLLSQQQTKLQHQITDLNKKLAAAKKAASQQNKSAQWLADLQTWRDIVHRDSLQKVMFRVYLEDCVEKINYWLSKFASSFSVTLDDESLTFIAVKPEQGISHHVNHLSGGQKVLLAIAYRLAVNTQDLLVLDEPTDGLDKANRLALVEILRNLRQTLSDEGKQIILVTHDEMLLGRTIDHSGAVFDDVIQL